MVEFSLARFRHPGWVAGGVIAVATAVLAAVAVLEYARAPNAGGASDSPPATSPAVSHGLDPAGPAGSTALPGPGTGTPLADLTPVSGAARLALLPEELNGEARFERAVVIACPSNQTGDRISEVTYETRHRYATLDAELRPYRNPPDDVLVNVRFFSDPQDREPGAAPPGEPYLRQLRMGEVDTVRNVGIGAAYYLRLRVECEKPGGYLILTGAVLRSPG